MNRVPRTRLAHAFRRTAVPLASYYAVTLAVPLANGAAQSGAFVEHALAVLVVPPVVIVLACTLSWLLSGRGPLPMLNLGKFTLENNERAPGAHVQSITMATRREILGRPWTHSHPRPSNGPHD